LARIEEEAIHNEGSEGILAQQADDSGTLTLLSKGESSGRSIGNYAIESMPTMRC